MKYLNITDCDIANGFGVRVTLYVSGCSHCCLQCHNPESWNPSNGVDFTSETLDQLIKLLKRPYIDGLTLSGGDPLFMKNRDTIEKICKKVKEECPDKNIWLYTGFNIDQLLKMSNDSAINDILDRIDVLVDGPFIKERSYKYNPEVDQKAWVGSDNQNIIRMKKDRA